jgi:hypothetical protein
MAQVDLVGAAVNPEKPPMERESAPAPDDLPQNTALEDFFIRMKQEFDAPKLGAEVPAAVQAIEKLSLQSDVEEAVRSETETLSTSRTCSACGSNNPKKNRFCAICGAPIEVAAPVPSRTLETSPKATPAMPAGEHHYHHHYHHHYFSSAEASPAMGGGESRVLAPRAPAKDESRLRAPVGNAPLSRAEVAVRKLTQDWALACNNKQLDDLVELYASDALLLRPNVLPVRGSAGIREFFFAALDSGLGEVEFESLRVDLLGDAAYEARCWFLWRWVSAAKSGGNT